MRILALFCLSSALSFAASWSGALVDSKCYDAEERNVNPWDTTTSVDRDKDMEIRHCSPSPKTKSFAIVDFDGLSYKLDSAGNAKAADIVRGIGKKSHVAVAIDGELDKHTIKVASISVKN